MREIRTSGSTRGQWVAEPSLTVLLYRSSAAKLPFSGPCEFKGQMNKRIDRGGVNVHVSTGDAAVMPDAKARLLMIDVLAKTRATTDPK